MGRASRDVCAWVPAFVRVSMFVSVRASERASELVCTNVHDFG